MMDGSKEFSIKVRDFIFSISPDQLQNIDIIRKSESEYHILKGSKSVIARLLSTGKSEKKMQIEVEGESYEVDIRDELDQMLDKMGFNTVSTKHIKEIKAPMPGLVLEVAIMEGQEVNEGDKILILEAMKMENVILVNTSARIKKVLVKAGQAVDKGQILVELE
jgi:biotin carboxyl carrier protein